MKYRFLDLRRNAVKRNLELRYAVNRAARNYLHQHNFMDIETPFLIKSTPEGAGFCGSFKNEPRTVLCIAAIATNIQTIINGKRVRSLLSDSKMLS